MAELGNGIIRFTDEDFDSVLESAKAYIKGRLASWNDTSASDEGMVIVELLAGMVDYLRFMQNRTATDSFPSTAQSFAALCRQAQWFGYHPHPAAAAQVDLAFTKANSALAATVPAGTRVSTRDGGVTFETLAQLHMPPWQASGTVGAVHGHRVRGQIIGGSDGTANQRFSLLSGSLVLLAEGENALTVRVGGEAWTEYQSLIWAAGAKGYRVWIDSDWTCWVQFGDGRYGNIPDANKQIVVDYITGGGVPGNVGAHTLVRMSAGASNIESVTNESPAAGGADRESMEDLRTNIPSIAITRGRAVTRTDYERLLEAFGEIDQIDVDHPQTNVVKVYVLPEGGNAPSDSLLDQVRDYLADIRMITEDVQVYAPAFVPVDLTVEFELEEDADSGEALAALDSSLRTLINTPEFARSLHIHDIYDLIDEDSNVQHATITLLRKSGGTGIQDIETVPGEVIVAGQVKLLVV